MDTRARAIRWIWPSGLLIYLAWILSMVFVDGNGRLFFFPEGSATVILWLLFLFGAGTCVFPLVACPDKRPHAAVMLMTYLVFSLLPLLLA